MCRSGVEGGRRCPSHSNPTAIAARNAKRRKQYKILKGVKSENPGISHAEAMSLTKFIMNNEHTSSTTLHHKNNFEETQQLEHPDKTYPADYEVDPHKSQLGISSVANEPADDLYQKETIRGVINYKHLNKDSGSEFGFKSIYKDARKSYETYDHSEKEAKKLDHNEYKAINSYSSNAYRWINGLAFNPKDVTNYPYEGHGDKAADKVFPDDPADIEESRAVSANTFTQKVAQKVTNLLDSAIAKGTKQQKIVYRGINTAEIIAEDSSTWGYNAEEWVNEKRAVGTEVVFDGYTSTTTNLNTARSFSKTNVLYQILTPEGIAMSSISNHSHEDEILLPRKQRYMVVGIDKTGDSWQHTVIQMVAINSKGEVLDGTNSDPIEPLFTDDMLKESDEWGDL